MITSKNKQEMCCLIQNTFTGIGIEDIHSGCLINVNFSGTLGSGLAILSRFPILSSSYLKFTLAGKPLKVFQGDYYVGKGCGSVCIDHPEVGLIDVYTTHVLSISR